MIKPLIALGVLFAGTAALASVGYMQTNRFAFTQLAEPSQPAVKAPAAVEPMPVFDLAAEEPVITEGPAELVIFEKKQRPRRAAVSPAPKAPVELVPCTGWRELGPVSTGDGDQPRQRRVQMLCPAGSQPPMADQDG